MITSASGLPFERDIEIYNEIFIVSPGGERKA